MVNAEIVAVGSEMLTPEKIDTNSLYLTEQLNTLGVEVVQKCIIGDDRERLASYLAAGALRSRIILITGGLGPTEDDVTRDAVASAFGRQQAFSQELGDAIAERFARMKRPMAENNRRQAMLIDGAEPLPNDRGTAPGQWLDVPGCSVVLLPGPPKEMQAMYELQVLPRLTALMPAQAIRTRFYRVAGMGESDLDQLIAPVYSKYSNPACTILAGPSDIQIHLRARAPTEAEADALLEEVGSQVEPLLGKRLYTRTGEDLETCVGHLLKQRQQTVAVAESATGGFLGARFTSVEGSSSWFRGGFLTYTNQAKTALLGISPAILEREGAVSEAVACQMAEAARSRLQSTYGVSITGFAGATGGTEAAPSGTVYVGLADASKSRAIRLHFVGDRERIRLLSTQFALDLLRNEMLS